MSNNTEQDVAFIHALADILRDSDLNEIEIERKYAAHNELKVRLSRASAAAPVQVVAPAAQPAPEVAAAIAPTSATPATTPVEPDLANAVTSPMVGTAYLSSEPGSEAFVKIGDIVAEGQTVLIIEAMKTMNQIPSPRAGIVRQILVANAEPVEFGHPLMIID